MESVYILYRSLHSFLQRCPLLLYYTINLLYFLFTSSSRSFSSLLDIFTSFFPHSDYYSVIVCIESRVFFCLCCLRPVVVICLPLFFLRSIQQRCCSVFFFHYLTHTHTSHLHLPCVLIRTKLLLFRLLLAAFMLQ